MDKIRGEPVIKRGQIANDGAEGEGVQPTGGGFDGMERQVLVPEAPGFRVRGWPSDMDLTAGVAGGPRQRQAVVGKDAQSVANIEDAHESKFLS